MIVLFEAQLSSSGEPILPVRKVKVVLIRVQKWQAGGTDAGAVSPFFLITQFNNRFTM